MNTEDKRMRFFDMQDHPERYSDEEFKEMLDDPEMQEFIRTLTDFRQATILSETRQARHTTLWRKVAAATIGILFLSGLSLTAVELATDHTPVIEPGHEVHAIHPTIGRRLNFTKEGERNFTVTDEGWNEEGYENYYDVLTIGCSFYCCIHRWQVSASSALKPQHDLTYRAENAGDLTYKTAWIEGVEGYGVGESITFTFPPTNPRITTVKIANGYTKTEKAWKENSRVTQLHLYVNGKLYAKLMLQDTRDEQVFYVGEIGYADRRDDLSARRNIQLRFEIVDYYPGDKYQDTAISEITFDGIDCH